MNSFLLLISSTVNNYFIKKLIFVSDYPVNIHLNTFDVIICKSKVCVVITYIIYSKFHNHSFYIYKTNIFYLNKQNYLQ